jgi:lipopolysaccharide transport system ATP-binding protein
MTRPAILVEHISKQYHIGGPQARYKTLRESAMEFLKSPLKKITSTGDQTIWALRDISFEVQPGEVVGVIGRNGAGKSTLLKLLSHITNPTEGRIEIYGRVGSLLEVGTGFHPELTGRDNIYLNGAILGMKRWEIARRFDEIVDFAEIEKFLDTPAKHYSSGMYMRLAFTVAAHLQPEILLVDEVLAVGDAEFQKKCLGKMGEVAKEGRTVLFVSHNMTAVKKLCHRAILLQKGVVIKDNLVTTVIRHYLEIEKNTDDAEKSWENVNTAPGNEYIRLRAVRILDHTGNTVHEINSQFPFNIEIDYWNLVEGNALGTTVVFYNSEGTCLLSSISNLDPEWHGRPRAKGLYRSVCHVPGYFFPDGRILITILVWGENYRWGYQEDEILSVNVHEVEGSARGDYSGGMAGVTRPIFTWETDQLKELS